MWRKFNRPKDAEIGNPTLIETTFDQQYLETIPEVDSIRSGQSGGSPPGLPELPFKAVGPFAGHLYPPAEHRASSIYSHPGLRERLPVGSHISDRVPSLYSEVSPLTSPRASTDIGEEYPDVSPIESNGPFSHNFAELGRRAQSPNPVPGASNAADSESPRSTRLPVLRRASLDSVGSKESAPSVEMATPKPLQVPKRKNPKLLSGFQERPPADSKGTTEPHREDPLGHPVYREPWKGASGRTALVDPVRNVPRLEQGKGPVSIRRKSVGKDFSAHTVVTVAADRNISAPPTLYAPPTPPPEASVSPIKPVAPLKVGNNTTRVRSPVTARNLSGPFGSGNLHATDLSHERGLSDTANGSRNEIEKTAPTTTREEPNKAPLDPPARQRPPIAEEDLHSRFSWTTYATPTPPPKTPENDPSSRFSWTTYATSAHCTPHTLARRDTTTPPVPLIPYAANAKAMRQQLIRSFLDDADSIPEANTSRKPTLSSNLQFSQNSGTVTATALNRSPIITGTPPADKSKSLPKCPPELEAKDRIGALEAHMDDLTRRRHNIGQILNVMQPMSLTYDLATRDQVEVIRQGLEDEMGRIVLEVHRIGMTLHRARKNRDEKVFYGDPPGFWIKRFGS